MDHHQQQQQQNRRRGVEAGGGGGTQNHPPSQPCPRCNSNNTKFCYYNNYSLSQPRYFCKGCRRYWTQGGTLRNVPVGGGCRKSKRPKLAPGTTSSGGSGPDQLSSLPQQPPQPIPILSHQLILNAQDHRLSMMNNNNSNNNDNIMTSNTSNNVNITSSSTNTNAGTMMMSHNFFGGGNSGFMPTLMPAMQGVNQPLSFGPNLGLLHGFGLPNFDPHQPVPQPPNQDEPLPSLYSSRELGSSSSMQEWNLSMTPGPDPGPVASQANLNSSNNNRNNNNNNNSNNNNNNDDDNSQSNQQWSNFLGTSGLDDP